LAVDEDLPRRVTGWSGKSPSHLRITFGDEFRPLLHIDHRAGAHQLPDGVIAGSLAFEALPRTRLRFPFDLRFERDRISISVDGRRRRFTVISCAGLAVATATFDECAIQVEARAEVIESVALRKLTERELRQLIASHNDRQNP
jgi:hypothetical protein